MKAVIGLAQGAALIVLATPGFAQITADDVWVNQTAFVAAAGLQLDGTLIRDGSVVRVTDYGISYTLPMGFGTLYMRSGDVTLTENADGTVAISVSPQSVLAFGGDITMDGDTLTLRSSFTVRQDGFVSTASGTPGEVTYATTTDMMDIALDFVSLYPDPGLAEWDIAGFFTMQDIVSTTRITVADEVIVRTEGTSGATVYDFGFDDRNGTTASVVGSASLTDSMAEVVLPGTPLDFLNLASALREGLSLTASSTALQTTSHTLQQTGGDVVSDQRQFAEETDQSFTLDQNRLSLTSSGDEIRFEIGPDMTIPFPLSAALTRADLSFTMPVSASPDPQDVGFTLNLRDVTVNEDIWSLADQTGALPHDPVTLAFSLSGQVRNSVDLFDFMSLAALEQRIMSGDMPVELLSLSLSGFEAAGVGVTATGEAAFTFDNTDLTTYGGMPRPVGTGSITVTGANALIDTLAQIGLLSEGDLIGVRPAIAMFAELTGEDQLTSSIDMTADGQIIVNGQRMQ